MAMASVYIMSIHPIIAIHCELHYMMYRYIKNCITTIITLLHIVIQQCINLRITPSLNNALKLSW